MTIALTGTTGALGGAVLKRLDGPLVLIGRDASTLAEGHDRRQAVYGDLEGMTAALAGVDIFFFVSGRESPTRLDEHLAVVASAANAGVKHIVYISFLGATAESTFTFGRHHYFTEQAIIDSGLDHTFLRDSLYQDYLPFMTGADGVIRGPAGDGTLSAVARDDVAEAAALILQELADGGTRHKRASYDMTGPEAIDLAEVARRLTAVSGHPVSYLDETEEEAYASRAQYHAPDFEVEGWVTSYQAIARGELSEVSNDLAGLLGRPQTSFNGFLSAHPESYAHIAS